MTAPFNINFDRNWLIVTGGGLRPDRTARTPRNKLKPPMQRCPFFRVAVTMSTGTAIERSVRRKLEFSACPLVDMKFPGRCAGR
jgi:hypothetical protein